MIYNRNIIGKLVVVHSKGRDNHIGKVFKVISCSNQICKLEWINTQVLPEKRRLTTNIKYIYLYEGGQKKMSMEGRPLLNRERVINHLVRYMPDVHIVLTTDRGLYATTKDMRNMGMVVCEDCGHIQAVEICNCKQCGEFLIFKP